jgi:hypothetical protein
VEFRGRTTIVLRDTMAFLENACPLLSVYPAAECFVR